jgi:4'-phosphopantetheinyl transferase EntD
MMKNRLETIVLEYNGDYSQAAICTQKLHWNTKSIANMMASLHPLEKLHIRKIKTEGRLKSYLSGRYVAKQVIATFEQVEKQDIIILNGIFGQPIIRSPKCNIQVSITHCNEISAAMAFPRCYPMGIDIEIIKNRNRSVFNRLLSMTEIEIFKRLPYSDCEVVTFFLSVKEALSKVIKTGLDISYTVFEISHIKLVDNNPICFFKMFPQFCTISYHYNGFFYSIAYPTTIKINFNPETMFVF